MCCAGGSYGSGPHGPGFPGVAGWRVAGSRRVGHLYWLLLAHVPPMRGLVGLSGWGKCRPVRLRLGCLPIVVGRKTGLWAGARSMVMVSLVVDVVAECEGLDQYQGIEYPPDRPVGDQTEPDAVGLGVLAGGV